MILQFWKRVRTHDPGDHFPIERKKLVGRVDIDCHFNSVSIPTKGDFLDICGKPHLVLRRMYSLDHTKGISFCTGPHIVHPEIIVDYEVDDSTYEGLDRTGDTFLFTLPALEEID